MLYVKQRIFAKNGQNILLAEIQTRLKVYSQVKKTPILNMFIFHDREERSIFPVKLCLSPCNGTHRGWFKTHSKLALKRGSYVKDSPEHKRSKIHYIYIFLVWHNIRQMQSLEEEFEQLVKKHSQERQNPNYLEEVTEGKEPALVH